MARVLTVSLAGALILGGLAFFEQAFSAGGAHQVAMRSIDFEPRRISVHAGDTVEWVNSDVVAHTATGKDKTWEVNVPPGRSGRRLMKTVGTFSYICRYHPNMTGEIVVEP